MPRLVTTAALSLLLFGCGRSSSPETSAVGASSPSRAAPDAGVDAGLLANLTQALRKFSAEQRRVPATLKELVAAGYLPELPQAPQGKVFAIDPKDLRVILK